MKRILLFAFSLAIAVASHAQRYAIVDTKYILEKMPDYKQAQQKLDQFCEQWQIKGNYENCLLNPVFVRSLRSWR